MCFYNNFQFAAYETFAREIVGQLTDPPSFKEKESFLRPTFEEKQYLDGLQEAVMDKDPGALASFLQQNQDQLTGNHRDKLPDLTEAHFEDLKYRIRNTLIDQAIKENP
ncbi:hypothetical protein ACFLZB_00730 [Nanoarchaeota archaeon]